MNVVTNNYNAPFDDLFIAHKNALTELGFGNISFNDSMEMIKFSMQREG